MFTLATLIIGIIIGILLIFISGAMFTLPRYEYAVIIFTLLLGIFITLVCTNAFIVFDPKHHAPHPIEGSTTPTNNAYAAPR